ncbi:beta-lactamase domain protein [Natronomonas pharaonis DSM 2160]|uniref:Beta-lactamase domain protein n=1 Tax=Natronomonas pharaonis (strain ATCC 35678 / DSM 2160 / CIP 103997 / JCM 8858 / NBRC 14720 / NCIMB 2260 / Gabara) TaxID=348780 RepID=A0A1U7EVJ0_NATPD|nr:MBL fold metallo-hydrolase [Natronomonas pharaonis]CAI49040.1 beta-lactamase domain protein [Natronomonas pharaonis DSM 2160]
MDARSTQGPIHRLAFDVDWRPGHVACYLVDGPEPVLVDAALPEHEAAFRQALAEHDYTPADIDHLLITHPHVDHVGLTPTLLQAGDPTVYAPAGVRERFNRGVAGLRERVEANCREAGFPDEQRSTAVEMAVESLERDSTLLAPEAVDVWLDAGEEANVGGLETTPVHVPGHQADHLCYPVDIDGEDALLAGDMGIKPFRPVVMHDGLDDGYREAFPAFYTALDRLDDIDVERVYPGHGPVHGDLAGAVAHARASLDSRLSQVADLVADGHATAPAVAMSLAGDREIEYLIPEAMSALAHLEAAGEIDSTLNDGVRYYDA